MQVFCIIVWKVQDYSLSLQCLIFDAFAKSRSGWVGCYFIEGVYLTLCLLTDRNLAVPKLLVKNKATVDAHGYV